MLLLKILQRNKRRKNQKFSFKILIALFVLFKHLPSYRLESILSRFFLFLLVLIDSDKLTWQNRFKVGIPTNFNPSSSTIFNSLISNFYHYIERSFRRPTFKYLPSTINFKPKLNTLFSSGQCRQNNPLNLILVRDTYHF